MKRLFDTQSHSWREVGLARQLSREAVKRARVQTALLLPLIAGILLVYDNRRELVGRELDVAVRFATVVALLILGWQAARAVGRALAPLLFRRMQPGTAGTVGFVIRLVTVLAAVVVAARIAGLTPRTLALGGAFTAVVVGLAAPTSGRGCSRTRRRPSCSARSARASRRRCASRRASRSRRSRVTRSSSASSRRRSGRTTGRSSRRRSSPRSPA